MLSKVMKFLKDQGIDVGKHGSGDDGEDDGSAGKNVMSGKGEDLSRMLSEQMAAAAAEHQRLLDANLKYEQEIKALTQRVRELEQHVTDMQDELAACKAQLSAAEKLQEQLKDQLQQALDDLATWKTKYDDEHALRTKFESELEALRVELASVNADMEAAARAGLTLTEMLAQLKADYEARIKALEEEIAALKNEVAQYKKGELVYLCVSCGFFFWFLVYGIVCLFICLFVYLFGCLFDCFCLVVCLWFVYLFVYRFVILTNNNVHSHFLTLPGLEQLMNYLPPSGAAAEDDGDDILTQLRKRLERALTHIAELEKAMAQADEEAAAANARIAELLQRNKTLEAQVAELKVG